MMRDRQKWDVGVARLTGLATYLPSSVNEDLVTQYHTIINGLEQASGENLHAFKIPDTKLAFKIIQRQVEVDGVSTHSGKKYCDSEFFRAQIDGLMSYLKNFRSDVVQPDRKDEEGSQPAESAYRALADPELEDIAIKSGIKPRKIFTERGEQQIFDRDYIIQELLKL